MSKLSQNGKVITHLKEHGTINCKEAYERYGIAALHSRISDLRNHYGMDITTVSYYDTKEQKTLYRYVLNNGQ